MSTPSHQPPLVQGARIDRKAIVAAYVGTLLAFSLLDAGWLSLMAPNFYQDQVGELLLDSPLWAPGVAFYLLYVVGLLVFCILPAWRIGSTGANWRRAAWSGALLGLVAYGTYDLSNLATLGGWTLPLTLVDMAWGTFASAVASIVGLRAAGIVARRGD